MRKKSQRYLRRALRYILPYWHLESIALFCAIVTAFLTLVNPWINKILIDDVIVNKNVRILKIVCLLFLAATVLEAIFSTLQGYLFTFIGQRAMVNMRHQLFSHLQRFSLSYFNKEKTGRIMSVFTSDIPAMQELYTSTLVDFITDMLRFVVTLLAMIKIDWKLTIIALPGLPLFVTALKLFSQPVRDISRKIQSENARLSESLQESISGIREAKAFTQEEYEINHLLNIFKRLLRVKLKQNLLTASSNVTSGLITMCGMIFVLFLGGMKAINGTMQMGVLVAFVSYLSRLYSPVRNFMGLNNRIQSAMGAAERVFGFLDISVQIQDKADAITLAKSTGSVRFENVCFAYEEGKEVLKDINLSVEAGEVIALVGTSGAGKSTLVCLLLRFYDPCSGDIFVDGYNLKDIKISSLRTQVSAVFQDIFLFGASIRENIQFGRRDATFEEILAAAKAANAHDFIMELPNGYETQVGERGVKLSGGQKQRISVARALLRNPRILILDEATSALDSESEKEIEGALEKLMEGRTSFIIAHRLSTIKRADRIVVLNSGSIKEVGTHEQLLKEEGIYSKLYNMQFLKG